jgi:DNA-binding IclR family transcriptional regulator
VRQHSGIGVLDKAVGVLWATAAEPCGLAELCERTGLPRATAHRLAVGLEAHGLLHRGADGRWRPGPTLSGLRDTVPVGSRLPMTAGSGAKVLAAWADPATQRAVLNDAAFTERTLLEVRRRGWAQSVAERESGVASVSAPVRNGAGQVIAAVSVSGPVERIGRRPGARWAANLLAAADALQHRL